MTATIVLLVLTGISMFFLGVHCAMYVVREQMEEAEIAVDELADERDYLLNVLDGAGKLP